MSLARSGRRKSLPRTFGQGATPAGVSRVSRLSSATGRRGSGRASMPVEKTAICWALLGWRRVPSRPRLPTAPACPARAGLRVPPPLGAYGPSMFGGISVIRTAGPWGCSQSLFFGRWGVRTASPQPPPSAPTRGRTDSRRHSREQWPTPILPIAKSGHVRYTLTSVLPHPTIRIEEPLYDAPPSIASGSHSQLGVARVVLFGSGLRRASCA